MFSKNSNFEHLNFLTKIQWENTSFLFLRVWVFSGKTKHAQCIKCITKKCITLTENMQLKVTSPRYFPGLFNLSLHKVKFTPKMPQIFIYFAVFLDTAKAYPCRHTTSCDIVRRRSDVETTPCVYGDVWNKNSRNSAGTFHHCVKSVYIRTFCGPYFPAFGLNTQRYFVSLRSQSECEKMPTRKTPNMDTFHAVLGFHLRISLLKLSSEFLYLSSEITRSQMIGPKDLTKLELF